MKRARWIVRNSNPEEVERISQQCGVGIIAATLISQRVSEPDKYLSWLHPKLDKTNLSKALLLPDIDILCELLCSVQNVGIFSDYDADGVLSAAIWHEFLSSIGKTLHVYIPSRAEGYGPNECGLKQLQESSELILCLDCGTGYDFSSVQCSVAVIDHHKISATRPTVNAMSFINPQRAEDDELRNMCAAGLSFLSIVAVVYKNNIDYNPYSLLDMAAVATIADVMLLTGLNRSIVAAGLKKINQRIRPEWHMLVARDDIITAEDIAYIIGPKINAAGRMSHANEALKLFTRPEAATQIETLNQLNRIRQEVQQRVLEEAEQQIADNDCIIVAHNNDWDAGVIGIVAGQLKAKYARPAIAVTGDTELKGSIRGTEDFDVAAWIEAAKNARVIDAGGGHRAAGGFTSSNLKGLRAMCEAIECASSRKQYIDAMVSLQSLIEVQDLQQLEPFGQGNLHPLFGISRVRVTRVVVFKERHASVTLTSQLCCLRVIAFNIREELHCVLLSRKEVDVLLQYSCKGYSLVDAVLSENAEYEYTQLQ